MPLTPHTTEAAITLWLLGHSYRQIASRLGLRSHGPVQHAIKQAQAKLPGEAGYCPQERTNETIREAWGGHPRPRKYRYTCAVCGTRGVSSAKHRRYCGQVCKSRAAYLREKARVK